MPKYNFNNNILDGEELFDHLNFEIPFSKYWQKIEEKFKPLYIISAIILIVILASVIIRDSSNLTFNYEIIMLITYLPIPLAFLLFIYQFQKFRNRNFKEKIIPSGRLWRMLIIAVIFGLVSAIVFANFIISVLISMGLLTYGFDGESMGMLIIYTPILLLSGFQTFYFGYSILYLIECKTLKNQYV